MKTRVKRLILLLGLLALITLVLVALFPGTHNPVALLRVVDATGKPIAGAIIRPDGLRTKPGPYSSGWYSWQPRGMGVPNDPVTTDAEGRAWLPYPKYVFERIETGTISVSVEHPDFVPERPERMVNFAPPSRAPWRAWLDYVWGRVRHKALVVRPDPIVLQQGGILRLKVRADSIRDGPLFAQVGRLYDDKGFWIRPAPNELVTKRLQPGPAIIRAVLFDTNGVTWFSQVTNITAVAEQTKEIEFELARGATVHGQLDESVVRPIRNGKVIANVSPHGEKPQNWPPTWHAWSRIREDGTFDIGSLPEGTLEIVALCDGYVSTNGPGQVSSFHYPQVHTIGTNDLNVTIGMERTCCLAVSVTDSQGKPVRDAQVMTWPNIRYGEWSATILGGDDYNTADFMRNSEKGNGFIKWWQNKPASFTATSDITGVALMMNLPKEAKEFSVTHSNFVLPARDDGSGQKRRQASMRLSLGQTNRVSVQLEPVTRAPIGHY
jgi:hypothetical protein